MTLAYWLGSLLIAAPLIAAEPTPPPDGSYQLHITHRARLTNNENPLKPIPSTQYETATGIADITVRISKSGKDVLLLPRRISGSRLDTTNSFVTYELKEGLFAGGSLTLEKAESGWIGTFTEFGSGRPILSSIRGPLTSDSKVTPAPR